MVRVIDDYVIENDELNYTVKVDKHKVSVDKNGVETQVFDTKGHYTSFPGAVKGIRNLMVANSLSEKVMSLDEALKTIQDIDKRFEELIVNE